MTDRNQAVSAIEVLLGYCDTFREDNENRENLRSKGELPDGVCDAKEANSQLEDHYAQKGLIVEIETKANEIKELLHKVTYRGNAS